MRSLLTLTLLGLASTCQAQMNGQDQLRLMDLRIQQTVARQAATYPRLATPQGYPFQENPYVYGPAGLLDPRFPPVATVPPGWYGVYQRGPIYVPPDRRPW